MNGDLIGQLFDFNSKIIRKYDDYNKIPDVLKDI